MLYQRLCATLRDKGMLVPMGTTQDYVDSEHDYYESIFYYNEVQFTEFQKTRTVRGMRDVITDKLVFDFDDEKNLENARMHAVLVRERLLERVTPQSIRVFFSGNKGFNIVVQLAKMISPKQAMDIAYKFTYDMTREEVDRTIYDPPQILRIPGTKHQVSSLYKIPLTHDELLKMPITAILEKAKSLDNVTDNFNWGVASPDEDFYKTEEEVVKKVDINKTSEYLDFKVKPKFLTNCRWSLQNGFFSDGSRNTAFLCLAATYKSLGFGLEHTYRLLKGVAQVQANRAGVERYPDQEIYNNIVMQVYSDAWKGGIYTCKDKGSWLHDYCLGLGEHSCKFERDDSPKTIYEIGPAFKSYVMDIDKNTIHTGIPSFDRNVFISTGNNVGLIGASGSGKSSVALNILNNTSKAGVKSVFASLDMHSNRMYEKVLYKISGHDRKDLYKLFHENKEGPLLEKLKDEFGNVFFFNRSSPTVTDVRNFILDSQEKSGEKIKLVMLDYFERISSDYSDDTAASKRAAGELQDLVNDLNVALITLVQPNKAALGGGVETPIYDYTKIKGSSFVYQSFRTIVSLWRPFYNIKTFKDDKYMQMAVIKNDLGELGEWSLAWNGKKGEITELEQGQLIEFEDLIQKQAQEKAERRAAGGGWH